VTGIADHPAHVYGTREPTVMHAGTEIGEAFHRMRMSGLTLLPVVEDERLSGIVLRVDLMQAMLMDASQQTLDEES
jgi:CBS domain-containing protein